jgi:thiosulfate dehydrogenase [quinone] large subunit
MRQPTGGTRQPTGGGVRPDERSPLLAAPWVRGPEWDSRGLRQTGWVLLPLRLFLGVTFVFAALQKLADPSFFDAASPGSVEAQMHAVASASPIGPLVQLSLHAGWLVGLVIALAELAVGVGTLLGLRSRLAAVGGLLLALSFFLTVSWTTSPYYYGADIVFFFAWTPFVAVGAAGVLSLDGFLAERRRAPEHDAAGSAAVARRALVGAGVGTACLAVLTAVLGRAIGGAGPAPAAGAGGGRARRTPRTTPGARQESSGRSASRPPTGMHPVADAGSVGIGQGARFNDPATGRPAWLVRSGSRQYDAFSAVCTHAGCTVNYDPSSRQFVCPCHGGTYSASDGRVLGGPPPSPLSRIKVALSGTKVYAR